MVRDIHATTIICSTRNHFAYSTVYDTVLEDKCTTKAHCGQQCNIVQDTKCETRWRLMPVM